MIRVVARRDVLTVVLAVSVFGAAAVFAQRPTPTRGGPQTIRLWPDTAPGALGDTPQDIPTLTIYLPSNTVGPVTAVIIMPGGGYTNVAGNAGPPTANYLNTLGVAAFVLKYRVGPAYHHPVELGDAQRAIRTVRSRAEEWQIAPEAVGVMGFSSGGHLASTASTHFDLGNPSSADPIERRGSRPDFTILASTSWDQADRTALLGDRPDPGLVWSLSNETQVTATTPPAFLFSTNADTEAPAEISVQYFLALRKAGVPAELHVFKDGAHGVAAQSMRDPANTEWPRVLATWLRASGLIK